MDSEKGLPLHRNLDRVPRNVRPVQKAGKTFVLLASLLTLLYCYAEFASLSYGHHHQTITVPLHAQETLVKCRALNTRPGASTNERSQSDRFQPGTNPIVIRNASIWTGLDNGLDVLQADLFLDKGLIKSVGEIDLTILAKDRTKEITVIDAHGAWLTPGIVDVHSHIAVDAAPALSGASDANSMKGLTLPWLRSVDGLNTHDDSYAHSIAGGVTTSLILPGSADAIGGQAFTIKLRSTQERSSSSLLVEPPFGLNGSDVDLEVPPRWRHMKHACARSYSGTRMDTVWSYREAYNRARQVKNSQDEYCSKALAGDWTGLGSFPENFQWEALVDVLRGKVKVHTHCYEAVDFDAFVRLSNEFQFPVAAFHHAHEAYLVSDVLKKAYEHPPAVAMFAAFSRYKREAYRHSEFAPRLLHDDGIKVIMKSDHPAIQSRYLLHEAQQAHYYGLPENVALASVISTAAEVLGLDHRLGYIKEDVVLWDSHPLALGATPLQVIIDGIPQISSPHASIKPASLQSSPTTPDFEKEAADAIKYEGLPPLEPSRTVTDLVIFYNVSSVWTREAGTVQAAFGVQEGEPKGVVVVDNGRIVCANVLEAACASYMLSGSAQVDLQGGSLAPALVAAGSAIGLQDIAGEPSTTDGTVYDAMKSIPSVVGGDSSIIKAIDGLQYGSRDALIAHHSGVTTAITAPTSDGLLGGLSAHFSLGSAHRLQQGAVINDVASVHVKIRHVGEPSVSTQIAALRRLLLEPQGGERGEWLKQVTKGEIPLVVDVKSADIIATLLVLKRDVEAASGTPIKMTLFRAAEAHLLAKEIAEANVGVIVTPPRSFPYTWEGRRILLGPPVTEETVVSVLTSHNVTVGIGPQGVEEEEPMAGWAVRNLKWDAAWVSIGSHGEISKAQALAMASTNIETLLGVQVNPIDGDIVATSGGDLLSFEGKVVAIVSPRRGLVDIL
ncbi:hypothetical protein SERLA73DRAFT_159873 [Serpula lacrymans var. lacrymans S7.3]|uniref:Amidohydrolase-related domain-containing protein n=1 Tax=Serpula lacrymans var. lacrymans (strain S7.3) TaxID=936435 RepID=F8PUD6_SERL3|nr:hypothetical protein SERLA73DRAFT_159873 [Serpula lacrymans var. lacrymans S7.3]